MLLRWLLISRVDRGQGLNNAISDAAYMLEKVSSASPLTRESLSAAVAEYEREMIVRGKEAVEMNNVNSLTIHKWETLLESPIMTIGVKKPE